MAKLVPILAAVSGTAIAGVGSGYLLSTQNTKTISETFKSAIIKLDGKDDSRDTLLKTKLAKLKEGKINSNIQKLTEAKNKEIKLVNSGLEELKQACTEIYKSSFTNKDSNIFKDFESYCSKNIKDVITADKWAPEGAKWKTRYDKLTENLTPELDEIKSKNSTTGNELKEWCGKVADRVFEGENDPTYIHAQNFCGKDD